MENSSPCPRCAQPLFAGEVGALRALACGACGGLWLNNEGTALVLRRFDIDASHLAALVDRKGTQVAAQSPFATAKGACPICTKALESVSHNGIKLDFCADHGTFFDRGELANVLDRLRPQSTLVHAHAGPSIEQIRDTVREEANWAVHTEGRSAAYVPIDLSKVLDALGRW
jgi:Zn-finger nucleic acid-binding protein